MPDLKSPPPSDPARFTVDTAQWPLVILTFVGTPTEQLFASHLKEIEDRVLARREPFAKVIDQRRGEMPDAIQRAMIADHQTRMDQRYRKYCLGEAYVVSPQLRGAMVAVFWRAPPPYPYTFVEGLPGAIEWARQRLKDAGRIK